VTINMFD